MVIAPLRRLKRHTQELAQSQLLVSLNNLQPEMLHLQRSLTMLASQFQAIKTALDRVRAAVAQARAPFAGSGLAAVKAQFGELFALLR